MTRAERMDNMVLQFMMLDLKRCQPIDEKAFQKMLELAHNITTRVDEYIDERSER